MSDKRRRPEMYVQYVSAKRKRYTELHKCIDCGHPAEHLRCNECNDKRNAYAREWRRRPENYHRLREQEKRWRTGHKENIRASNLKARAQQYDLTVDEYLNRLKTPCGICGGIKPRMTIDHCHTTNDIRGVLCSACNSQLGWYENNKEAIARWLMRASVDNRT